MGLEQGCSLINMEVELNNLGASEKLVHNHHTGDHAMIYKICFSKSENSFVIQPQYRDHESDFSIAFGENFWLLDIQQISNSPARICNSTEDS